MKLYYDLFRTVMNSPEIDGLLRANPCRAIKTAAAFRGLTSAPRWIPAEAQVLDLFDVVPNRYHAALWLGAGQGCRIGEVLAIEDSPACIDLHRGELHVRQLLQYDSRDHGGLFLKEPKGGSAGTVTLETAAGSALAQHLSDHGICEVNLVDPQTANRADGQRSCCSPMNVGDRSTTAAGPNTGPGGATPPDGRSGTAPSTPSATSAPPPC
ncbi:hypothetical protein Vau01_052210 [Virgisporangium aurantiacum]|uniref:Tyr recombinase domain-containing protein n=1 Tax=Virgisporangium aurantiacum TaxID=175570 RepID=A0A8J3Z9G9_9ACTN|nr:hypothetical protein Vau01_052210 [Virgisporangium aurantiacum]